MSLGVVEELLVNIKRSCIRGRNIAPSLDAFMDFVDGNPAFTREGWIEAIEAARKRQQGEA